MLQMKITPRAAKQMAAASTWWRANRLAAPEALRDDLLRALELISHQPLIGARVLNARLVGVRRIHLPRVHYDIYYRVRQDVIEILVFWHVSRGSLPRI